MKQSPIINALMAILYISAVVLFLRFLETFRHDTPDTLLDGMGAISLFVFSAAVMAFLFFYQPVLLLLENKKREALSFFLTMITVFGLITLSILTLVSLQ